MARLGPARPPHKSPPVMACHVRGPPPAKNAGSMLLQTEEEPDQSKPRRKKLMGGPARNGPDRVNGRAWVEILGPKETRLFIGPRLA